MLRFLFSAAVFSVLLSAPSAFAQVPSAAATQPAQTVPSRPITPRPKRRSC
ncbi:hypothetical protein [Hymenobacter cellulosilyticus]|uniref:Uncharacterized protein n=1 Tax=Hymenobacter cellulosilyticus TaxID=2932248 RepID=A0A8T9Q040_9BACT|nr:hypothetical protein [Hymenobacter cellulosilyticus]UOQ70727.1 hypothetical protein MUN79_18790 [Hymenobacter cellulosilyticus]